MVPQNPVKCRSQKWLPNPARNHLLTRKADPQVLRVSAVMTNANQ